MIKNGSKSKTIVIFISNFFAYALVILSYGIPLYPYEWSDEPSLAKQVDLDSVLVILFLSALGSFCAIFGLIMSYLSSNKKFPFQNLKGLIFPIGALILCVYQFIQTLPLYSG